MRDEGFYGNERLAAVYDKARALPEESLDGWREAIARHLVRGAGGPVLDLGSGTGLFSVLLADWFDSFVVAIEPSQAMRAQASLNRSHPDVAWVGGKGEHIPLREGCCAWAWLSTVVHHVSDMPACAREVARVVRPGGLAFVRNAFSGRCDGITWLRFWPHVRALAESRWPSVESVTSAFVPAGFSVQSLESVSQVVASSLRAYGERVGLRADSTLAIIDEGQFEQSMAALRRAAAEEAPPQPVIDRLDLLTLRLEA